MSCFGSAFDECKSCIPFSTGSNTEYKAKLKRTADFNVDAAAVVMDPNFAKLSITTQSKLLSSSSCSIPTAIECAAKVAECSVTCYENGITSSSCMSCFGDTFDE
eukprot:Pgem_evm1s13591